MDWINYSDAPIYSQLAKQIRSGIVSGEYEPGAKLPSVRDLALAAGVNPNTMQRAMMQLEREGLVFPQRTAGRFVTDDAQLIAQARQTLAREQAEAFLTAMNSLGYRHEEILSLVTAMVEEDGHGST